MTKVRRCGLMTLRDYWVSFDHREKDTDGGFDILKGKGLLLFIFFAF